MLTTSNNYNGAAIVYNSERCVANGEFRCKEGKMEYANICGDYTKGDNTYTFGATMDAEGIINIAGVPASVLTEVADEVATIIGELKSTVFTEEE